MANLYGLLFSDRAKTVPTRLSNNEVTSRLEDWNGSVTTVLDKWGDVKVFIGRKGSNAGTLVYEGNIANELDNCRGN
jgi:hypothetical protein